MIVLPFLSTSGFFSSSPQEHYNRYSVICQGESFSKKPGNLQNRPLVSSFEHTVIQKNLSLAAFLAYFGIQKNQKAMHQLFVKPLRFLVLPYGNYPFIILFIFCHLPLQFSSYYLQFCSQIHL